MNQVTLRRMQPADRWDVADLICLSTNVWYQTHGRPLIFPGGPSSAVVFFDVYEALDPGCGYVAVHNATGRLAGSCFFHPRPTHVSLGIMNVHPNYFGLGVARTLFQAIADEARGRGLPLRLVSSAMNLDSFSLYTRGGMVPQTAYQDMYLYVPETGLPFSTAGDASICGATDSDVPDMVALEIQVAGLNREQDYRYFLANREGFWHTSVSRDASGALDGFMVSCGHAGCNMIGPGTSRTPQVAAALILAELGRHRGRTPVLLCPMQCTPLVQQLYAWGAKNCETHLSQVLGEAQPLRGVHLPTFLPESS